MSPLSNLLPANSDGVNSESGCAHANSYIPQSKSSHSGSICTPAYPYISLGDTDCAPFNANSVFSY